MARAGKQPRPRETSPLALGGLLDLLGFHLRLAQIAMYRDFAASLADIDLTQKQYAVLSIVGGNPGPSQVDIAALLGMDRATMMALVDRLQDRKLVERRRSKEDRRRQELYLTPTGKKLLTKASALIVAHDTRFTDRVSPTDQRKLFEFLRRIHGQM